MIFKIAYDIKKSTKDESYESNQTFYFFTILNMGSNSARQTNQTFQETKEKIKRITSSKNVKKFDLNNITEHGSFDRFEFEKKRKRYKKYIAYT